VLIDSATVAEKEYLDNLEQMEKKVVLRLRDSVACSAVEQRIKNENSTTNLADFKEQVCQHNYMRKRDFHSKERFWFLALLHRLKYSLKRQKKIPQA